MGYNRSNLYYRRKPINDEPIITRLKSLATERPRWGWCQLLIMVRRDKIVVGETRFRRIYRALELQVRPRRKRKVNCVRGNFIEPVSPMSDGRLTSCTIAPRTAGRSAPW